MADTTVHILILDEVGTPSLNKAASYTSFVSPSDNVRLLIISSKGALSDADKADSLAYVELATPTTNGLVEVEASALHAKHRIDRIYTKQEDLILRASLLRELLGIKNGLNYQDAILFRDKEAMKRIVKHAAFPVPSFARVYSPASILQFLQMEHLPIILKPTLGSASAGITVLRTDAELKKHLEKEFYERIDDKGKCMDYSASGDIIVEAFVDPATSKMYHVNGYAQNGALKIVWPFAYIQTNLGFTTGKAYGNVLIPQSDPKNAKLLEATEKVLKALPTVDHLIFHLELFETKRKASGAQEGGETTEFVLCEIAARRPGGSIGGLIGLAENYNFAEMEFRLSNGLPLRQDRSSVAPIVKHPNFSLGDLLIPRRIGKLLSIPGSVSLCPVSDVQYFPIAKSGTEYTGFHISTMNTAARLVVTMEDGSAEAVQAKLAEAQNWFDAEVRYEITLRQ
ncbi:ATP-grasp domain-containing protein [Fimicolochytrium jonesii]|uniref:ATP-grasp domain-containing protein n=1 Tax=Fimicolochytrium jonesii TaxID=1396493 RepID=UPI0022FDE434|nr:ATP-grasp domain-containing protein [Fimicolochytrium jonesii]KAI8819629.1 ATP-grasp domain-containing protein [Fimicolochytrium jonesii]